MTLALRPIAPADLPAAGRICHDAFRAIATEHNFPPDFPTPEVGISLLTDLTNSPGFYGVVAEIDGQVVGSNFIDERSPIIGLGPITVDPAAQNQGAGNALMTHMLDRAEHNGAPGVRLVQAGYHRRSLCLYTKLGFAVREHLTNLQGPALGLRLTGRTVRPAATADLAACNRLCRAVHGLGRGGSLRGAIVRGTAAVVEHDGRITGYTTEIGFGGHTVAEIERGSEGADWRGAGVWRPWFSPAQPQHRTVSVVPGERAQNGPVDDPDDSGSLQRAAGCLSAIDLVLMRPARQFAQ